MSNNNNNNSSMTTGIIEGMLQQERNGYETRDYLSVAPTTMPQHHHLNNDSTRIMVPKTTMDIDRTSRDRMVHWCFQVVDFCNFSHETVAIAMNYVDRYMSTARYGTAAKQNRETYQLLAMTSLYTAVKIHEPEAMDPALVSRISRGTYQPKQIEDMEFQLLTALQWRVNPPTAMAFVRQCLDHLLPAQFSCDQEIWDMVHDLAEAQTELAVSNYDFVGIQPSLIAYCALMNAFVAVGVGMDENTMHALWMTLAKALHIDNNKDWIAKVQNLLYHALVTADPQQDVVSIPATTTACPKATNSMAKRQDSSEVSPRCAAATTAHL